MNYLISTARLCPYCGGIPKLADSSQIYGRDYGKIWLCPCGAFVGCHIGTKRPLGRVANAELRALKKEAHRAFDPLWRKHCTKGFRKYKKARNNAYAWLSKTLNIEKQYAHIGMLDDQQCKKLIEICRSKKHLYELSN